MTNFKSNDELEKEGLTRISMYSVMFWHPESGWSKKSVFTREEAESCKGFGDFAGYTRVVCIAPIEAKEDRRGVDDA